MLNLRNRQASTANLSEIQENRPKIVGNARFGWKSSHNVAYILQINSANHRTKEIKNRDNKGKCGK